MRKTEDKDIRGRRFKVTQLPGMRGTLLFYRLSGVIVPALTKIGRGLELLDGKLANSNAMDLLAEMHDAAAFLFEKLPPDAFEKLLRELFETTVVKPFEGPEQLLMPIFDDELAGEVGTVLQLLAFALKVNFGNFMPGLVAQARRAATAVSASKESTTSPGLAGA